MNQTLENIFPEHLIFSYISLGLRLEIRRGQRLNEVDGAPLCYFKRFKTQSSKEIHIFFSHSRGFTKPCFICIYKMLLKSRFKIWRDGLEVGGAEYFSRGSEFIKWSDLVHCQCVFQVDYMHFVTKNLGCGLLK